MTPPSPLGDRSASSANATELDPIELGLDIATELMRGGAAANEYLEAILDDGETECTRAARAAGGGGKPPPSVPIITAPRRRTPEQRERDAECRRQRRAKEECKEAELEEQRAMYQIKYVSKACDQRSPPLRRSYDQGVSVRSGFGRGRADGSSLCTAMRQQHLGRA